MRTLEIKHTEVLSWNLESIRNDSYRFIVNIGGSRSSKSWSLCQLMIIWSLTNPNKTISIVRKSFPALRGSILRDFIEVIGDMDLYEQIKHNKTENTIKFDNGSLIEFFSVDDEQKLRGRRRDILWANEANELTFEEFNQLNMRTTEKLFFDFNPSDNYHWLYDLITRDNCKTIHSTYKNNPFLAESQVKEIENLINVDEGYYRVYALGERATGKTTIYTHWKYLDGDLMEDKVETIYGLDFGYNNPTSLIQCNFFDGTCQVKEIFYEKNLTSSDIVRKFKEFNISQKYEVICDSARPEIIEDLRRSGFNAREAIKDVKAGIDSVKSTPILIHKESVNLLKEIVSYKWKTNGDIILDEPVKIWDHSMDALRYAIHWWKVKHKKTNPAFYRIRY